ncbi:T9SS type A sorting domain-containing protein [Bacteroidales bacterium OttesenSCG-928-K03]|nr:T9SS type A sorting domain-containing protein [Odoribacter sp. OttesenSCG-928-L07]MDL2242628.1 T9SS type A sorting domain-containing protein [Bacteroidales bacterium OttesenSCG-928-K03]
MLKFKISFVLLIFALLNLNAAEPFVTPGNNNNYTLDDIVSISNGALLKSDNTYKLMADITISSTDKLIINIDANILCEKLTTILCEGILEVNPPEFVNITSIDTSTPDNYFTGIILKEDADNSFIKNLYLTYSGGLKLYDVDNVIIENSSFKHNNYNYDIGAGAISLSNCNPQIINCTFENNERSAIQSPANASAAPYISGCSIINNNTSNGNYPQINLGQSDEDTIYIVNNFVEGMYPKAGGISVSSLAGGKVNAVIKDNVVKNNRYGIAGTGNDIYMKVVGNECLDNNIENDPMSGGSGLNLYSTNTSSFMFASENIISGNLWGITLQGAATANFGCLDEGDNYNIGKNYFSENGNNGQTFHLYNNTANDIFAVNNDWSCYSEDEIEETIFHSNDDNSLGTVTFMPFYSFVGIENDFSDDYGFYPNPVNDFILIKDDNIVNVTIYNLQGKEVLKTFNCGKQINVSNLPNGFYLISLQGDRGKIRTSKLLIKHN